MKFDELVERLVTLPWWRPALIAITACVLCLLGPTASATTASRQTITSFTASPTSVTTSNGLVKLKVAFPLSNSTTCTYSAVPALVGLPITDTCSGHPGALQQNIALPLNTNASVVKYKITLSVSGPNGTATAKVKVKVAPGAGYPPISGLISTTGGVASSCGVLSSGGVDCWGRGYAGELGNGKLYKNPDGGGGSATAVQVVGAEGTGTLSGVTSLISDEEGFCALLTTSGVDCWGDGTDGALGNGSYGNSAIPVAVEGVGGVGTLSGATSLVSDGDQGYCALLTTSAVDCWGDGSSGVLGNGSTDGSLVPVQVVGVGGSGTLSGVASVATYVNGGENSVTAYCALLLSGGVDCWGDGRSGELGGGSFTSSSAPVEVEGVAGTGTLSGATSLTGGLSGFCAVLTSGGVDCWGEGAVGELGNGLFYPTSPYGSATPVQVIGTGGTGTLSGAASLASDGEGFCAILTSGGVDCWGYGPYGELGNGAFYTTGSQGSATPVHVVGVGSTGSLANVATLNAITDGYCALLTTAGVDCWGYGEQGQLGNGTYYTSANNGSAVAVQVEGIGDTGTLSGVSSLEATTFWEEGGPGTFYDFCAVLSSGGAACWGSGGLGALGDGFFYTSGDNLGSATPAQVVSK